MFKRIILLCFIVYYVMANSTFFGNNRRAELFELTDNEIATFKINLPEEELKNLKNAAQKIEGFVPKEVDSLKDSETPESSVDLVDDSEFKTKNVSMVVEIKGEENVFNKVTFSLGGSSSRAFGKQGYNIKIRGNKNLYGRTQIRLRPDARDASFLRSKISYDIHNRLGVPSISANYAVLYINEEYYGLYVLMDSIKLSWVEAVYDDQDSTTLYKCKNMGNDLSVEKSATGCVNDNEDVTDNSEWIELLTRLDAAQVPEDIEDIFDIDQFLTEIAFEYLSGSWDHYNTLGHNFDLYKPKGESKWKFISNDYDADLGQEIISRFSYKPGMNLDIPNYSFEEFHNPHHLYDVLIFSNTTRFDNILKKIVTEAFNPTVLFPHIDEVKEFIRPYVELDKTPNENGELPGKLNKEVDPEDEYTYAKWDANCEFTSIKSANSLNYGLKYWILMKYRYVCKSYDMTCDPYYMDENYSYTIDEEVGNTIEDLDFISDPSTLPEPKEPTSPKSKEPTTTTKVVTATTHSEPKKQCMSEIIGYECCSSAITKVYAHDSYGDWGYDYVKKEWCGLTPYSESESDDEECWSEIYGYPCCRGCAVFETDDDGSWGYENEQWCGVKSSC